MDDVTQEIIGAAIEAYKLLARILHEGFGIYGQAGKAGWMIARGFIAIAMDQGGSFNMRSQIVHKTK